MVSNILFKKFFYKNHDNHRDFGPCWEADCLFVCFFSWVRPASQICVVLHWPSLIVLTLQENTAAHNEQMTCPSPRDSAFAPFHTEIQEKGLWSRQVSDNGPFYKWSHASDYHAPFDFTYLGEGQLNVCSSTNLSPWRKCSWRTAVLKNSISSAMRLILRGAILRTLLWWCYPDAQFCDHNVPPILISHLQNSTFPPILLTIRYNIRNYLQRDENEMKSVIIPQKMLGLCLPKSSEGEVLPPCLKKLKKKRDQLWAGLGWVTGMLLSEHRKGEA